MVSASSCIRFPQIGQEEDDIAIGGGALWNDGILRGSDLYFEKNNAAVSFDSVATYAHPLSMSCAQSH